MNTPKPPASLAEHIALYHPVLPIMNEPQYLAFRINFCRERILFFTEAAHLDLETLLKVSAEAREAAFGATESTDALLDKPVPANASALKASPPPKCICPVSNLGRPHLPDCPFGPWMARTGATEEYISIGATVIHPPEHVTRSGSGGSERSASFHLYPNGTKGFTVAAGGGSGATEAGEDANTVNARAVLKLKRVSAGTWSDADCSPTFCLQGWRGREQCTSYCKENERPRSETAEGATGGADCSASKAGARLSDDKPPEVINITPAHLSEEDRLTLTQLQKRAELGAFIQSGLNHSKKGSAS